MAEEIKKAKTGLIMITYAILLLAGLLNLNGLLSFLGKVISLIALSLRHCNCLCSESVDAPF